MKKLEVFAVVDAGIDTARETMYDIVENSVDNTDLENEAEAMKSLESLDGKVRDPKEPYHKVVKITIEDVTTL